jgi:predicted homoserine dehydrogenase-like protein
LRFGEAGKLMDNSRDPSISVNSIAKRDLKAGEEIRRGIGSFDFRGEACRIADHPNHLPIGLLQNATITRELSDGDILTMDDVELPDSRALEIWRELRG